MLSHYRKNIPDFADFADTQSRRGEEIGIEFMVRVTGKETYIGQILC